MPFQNDQINMSLNEENRNLAEDTSAGMEKNENQDENGVMEVESLCMNCHKNVSHPLSIVSPRSC